MTSFSGCVVPVGPHFEDPPAVENVPPFITSSTPAQGQTVTAVNGAGMFSVTFNDLNADQVYLRWIGEYPPFNQNSHVLEDMQSQAPVNHQPTPDSKAISVSCVLSHLAISNSHTITVFVSDQPFWDDPSEPNAPTGAEQLLTQNKANSVTAQANWVLNLPCSN